MLSRRNLFTLGLSRAAERVAEELDQKLPDSPARRAGPPSKPRVPARPGVPPPAPAWAHKHASELWAPVSAALPRPPGARVLEVDELRFDLAQLPFEDAAFDTAVSAFAPMFSSDCAGAIGELMRVVVPGGLVAFTAWTPAGIVGRLLRLAEEHDPPRPGTSAPMDWSREERLREELSRHSDDFELRPGGLTLSFASREEASQRLFASFRPLAWATRQHELRDLAAPVIDELARDADGRVTLRATYVMAVARRRSA
ncbi:MAG: hypothetical protein QOE11_3256 [Solirubrobacteraceae bacterium]|jgi:SAM-dependent methyltransferase|nr:hypothetical protein [Solirubrobacteraceae bacterium]